MQLDHNESLTEIMGTFIRNRPATLHYERPGINYVDPPPTAPTDLIITGVNIRNCATLEGWQSHIINNLSVNNQDQYVIARPGGGKTLPIICYWTDHLLNLNASNTYINIQPGTANYNRVLDSLNSLFSTNATVVDNTAKILFMVPVIALAMQTAAELRRDLAGVMMQYYNANPNTAMPLLIASDPTGRLDTIFTQRGELVAELAIVRTANPGRVATLENTLKAVNKSVVEEVIRVIATIVNQKVFVRTGGTGSSTTPIRQAIAVVSIYESAGQLVDNIRNLRLVVVDESHLAQSSGITIEDQSRSYQIAGSLFTVFKKMPRDDCRLVFLTGTINPQSATMMTNYLNRHFHRTFPDRPQVAPESAANRSYLSVVQNERIRTDEGIVETIMKAVRQNDWGQLFVLFSSATIANILRMCINKINPRNVENIPQRGYEPSNVFSGLGKRRQDEIQRTDSISLTNAELLSVPPDMRQTVANITNQLLRQSVLRGVGFIHRKVPGDKFADERELKMDDRDKMIVAKLFRDRKINVVLATDAVGIGVNIDVKELYIPSIEKYNKTIKNHAESSLRDLAQILNRAGRGATPVASIHTTKENMEIVNNALYARPDDFEEVDPHKRTSDRFLRDPLAKAYDRSEEGFHSLIQRIAHPFDDTARTRYNRRVY